MICLDEMVSNEIIDNTVMKCQTLLEEKEIQGIVIGLLSRAQWTHYSDWPYLSQLSRESFRLIGRDAMNINFYDDD
jgi:hypothetical protein